MVKFVVPTTSIEIEAGKPPAPLSLVITNESRNFDDFRLLIQPIVQPDGKTLNPAWIVVSPAYFGLRPLEPGALVIEGDNTQTITLRVNVPPGTLAGTYSANLILNATTPANNRMQVLTVVVREVDEPVFTITPPEKTSRRRREEFQLALTNRGNAPRFYSLYAEDDDNQCHFELTPPEVSLIPGESTPLRLIVRPKDRNWVSDPKEYRFKIELADYPQRTLEGQFIQKCALSPLHWMGQHWMILTTGLVVLVAAVVALLILLAPNIPERAAFCSPLSSREVEVTGNGSRTQIYVSRPNGKESGFKRVIELDAREFPGLFATLVSVSPDGRRLAYIRANNLALENASIVVLNLDVEVLPTLNPGLIPTPAIGQPARIFKTITPTEPLWPTAPVWSSDGEQLAYVVRPKNGRGATTTTVGAQPSASPTLQASPSPEVTLGANATLEVWVANASNPGDQGFNKLQKPPKIAPELFYGQPSRVVCWSGDDSRLILTPEPNKQLSSNLQTEVYLPEGKSRVIARPTPASTLAVTGPSLSDGLPLKLNQWLIEAAQTVPNNTQPAPGRCAIQQPYSMNDPAWSERVLKLGTQSKLSDSGCAITAAAMLFNYYQFDKTRPPDLLNINCLGDQAAALFKTGWERLSVCSPTLKGFTRTEPFSWDVLSEVMKRGPALVGLYGGPTGIHYVVANSGVGAIASTYKVTDPWDGSTNKTLSYFLTKGYNLASLIVYDGPGSACNDDQPGEQIEISGTVQDGMLYRSIREFQFSATQPYTATLRFVSPGIDLLSSAPRLLTSGQLLTFSEEGFYSISIEATGNRFSGDLVGSKVIKRELTFVIDRTPPVALPVQPVLATDNNFSFLQFQVTDNLSGVAAIEYCLKEGGASKDLNCADSDWLRYNSDTAPAVVKLDKSKAWQGFYRARDGAGNLSEKTPFEIKVINPPPPGSTPPVVGSPGVTVTNPALPGTPTGKQATPPGDTGSKLTTPSVATQPAKSSAQALPPQPTFTPLPNPAIDVTTVLTYDPGVTNLKIEIKNKRNGQVNWNISPGASAGQLTFSQLNGVVGATQSNFVTVTLLSPNTSRQVLTTNFSVNSNVGPRTVQVQVKPANLPSATFKTPLDGAVLAGDTTVSLSVSVPGQSQTPDHALITANLQTCPSCPLSDAPLPARPNPGNNWTVTWATSKYTPQSNISLSGKLCFTSDESNCIDIPKVGGLSISLDADIISPAAGAVLSTQAQVEARATGRTLRVLVRYTTPTGEEIPIGQLDASNGFKLTNWDTTKIEPGVEFILKAKACSSLTDDTMCVELPAMKQITGLKTSLSGSATFSGIGAGNKLTGPVTIKIQPSPVVSPTNIRHGTVLATYRGAGETSPSTKTLSTLILNPTTAPTWQAVWNPTTLPAQDNIKLEVKICSSSDDSKCVTATNGELSGLSIAGANVETINIVSGAPQYTEINKPFPNPFIVQLLDINNNPLPNVLVTFTPTPSILGATGSFIGSGVVTPYVATSDANGKVTTPQFRANGVADTYLVTVIAGSKTTTLILTNTVPDAIPLEIVAGSPQAQIRSGIFGTALKVKVKNGAGTGVNGVSVVFTTPAYGPTGRFPGPSSSFTTVSAGGGFATADPLTANATAGNYVVVAIAEGPYAPAYFELTNQNPIPTISNLNPDNVGVGGPGFILTVTGNNFIDGKSKVRWNGADRTTTFVNVTTLTAQIPATDVDVLNDNGAVTVFTPGPGGGTSNTRMVTVGADLFVGNGLPGSCTAVAFDNAFATAILMGGGTIRFRCSSPGGATLIPSTSKTVGAGINITLDTITYPNGLITLDGAGTKQLFNIMSTGSLTLKGGISGSPNLVLKNGKSANGGAIDNAGTLDVRYTAFNNNTASGNGGAINNAGTLTVLNSTFDNNTASGNGGAINNTNILNLQSGVISFASNSAFNGGAIASSTSVTFPPTLVDFTANSATGDAGALYVGSAANITVQNASFTSNTAASGKGGAIFIAGALSLPASTVSFTSNSANSGGAIYNNGGLAFVAGSQPFNNNTASGNGGAIYNNSSSSVTIPNGDFTANKATGAGGAIYNSSTSDLTLNNGVFTNNEASGGGGALFNANKLKVNIIALTNNKAKNSSSGGAIYNSSAGSDLTITSSKLENNSAEAAGGGLYNLSTATISLTTFVGNKVNVLGGIGGGAIYNSSLANLTTTRTTFDGNTTVLNGAGVNNDGTLNMGNTTFSGNKALGVASEGGALYNSGVANLYNVTIGNNSTTTNTNGGAWKNTGSIFAYNTLVANNNGGNNCAASGTATISGPTSREGGAGGTCALPLLLPTNLAGSLSGSAPQVLVITAGSGAIGAGSVADCNNPFFVGGVDQTGYNRFMDAQCDIGAYEWRL